MGVDDLSKIPWFEEPKKKEEVEITIRQYTKREVFINMLKEKYENILFSIVVGICASGAVYMLYQMIGFLFLIFLFIGILTATSYTAFLWYTRER